jgi:hypothetical protein
VALICSYSVTSPISSHMTCLSSGFKACGASCCVPNVVACVVLLMMDLLSSGIETLGFAGDIFMTVGQVVLG